MVAAWEPVAPAVRVVWLTPAARPAAACWTAADDGAADVHGQVAADAEAAAARQSALPMAITVNLVDRKCGKCRDKVENL